MSNKKEDKKQQKNIKASENISDNKKPERIKATAISAKVWSDDAFPRENTYYTGTAKKIKHAKYVVIFVLVLFCLAMISFYRNEITVENFRYMIRDLDAQSKENDLEYSEIIYDNSGSALFGGFKNELAIVKEDSVSLYNLSGSNVLRASNAFYDPQACFDGKYMLIYDIGATTYSYTLYNSFSELHTEKYDYPISCADINSDGTYAIVSATKDYRGAVYVYNSSFEPCSRIYKEKYVSDVAISPSSSDIVIVSSYSEDGAWVSEVQIASVKTGEEKFKTTFNGIMPLKAAYFSDGGFAVVFDTKTIFYNSDGEVRAEYSFDGRIPVSYYINNSYIVFAFNKTVLGTDKEITVVSSRGEPIFSDSINGQITNIDGISELVYVLTDYHVYRLDINNKATDSIDISESANGVVAYNDHVVVCYPTRALILNFESNLEGAQDTEQTSESEQSEQTAQAE